MRTRDLWKNKDRLYLCIEVCKESHSECEEAAEKAEVIFGLVSRSCLATFKSMPNSPNDQQGMELSILGAVFPVHLSNKMLLHTMTNSFSSIFDSISIFVDPLTSRMGNWQCVRLQDILKGAPKDVLEKECLIANWSKRATELPGLNSLNLPKLQYLPVVLAYVSFSSTGRP